MLNKFFMSSLHKDYCQCCQKGTTATMIFILAFSLLISSFATPSYSAKPTNVHVTFGQSYTDMNILWSSLVDGNNYESQLIYGNSVFNLTSTVSAASTESDIFGRKMRYSRVKLEGMKPGTKIVYKAKEGTHTSDLKYLKLPFLTPKNKVKFIVTHGGISGSLVDKLSQSAQSGENIGLVHLGSLQTTTEELTMMSQLNGFIPYLPTVGPGDEESGRYSQYRLAYSTPNTPWPIPIDRLWYSFDIGPIHFISYNTEVYDDNESDLRTAQHNWLLDDLTVVNNRELRPWVIAFGYRSLYCACPPKKQKLKKILKDSLEDIFFQNGVDLVLSGEGNGYQRTRPVHKDIVHSYNFTSPTAPVYVSLPNGKGNVSNQTYDWIEYDGSGHTDDVYGELVVMNSTHLIWRLISMHDDSVIDSFDIHQDVHDQFVTVSAEENASKVTKVVLTTIPVPSSTAQKTLIMSAIGEDNKTTNGNVTISGLKRFWNNVRRIFSEYKAAVIGGTAALTFVIFIICVVGIVRCKRVKRANERRRWQRLDCDKKFYTDVKTDDDDEDSCDDGELNIDGNKPTSNLLKGAARKSVL